MLTAFAVIGCLWFGLHAVEYVASRYTALGALVPIPAEYGLSGLLSAAPGWGYNAVSATVWLGLLGSILLLLRDRAAVLVLSATVIASLVALVWAGMAFADGLVRLGGVHVVQFAGSMAGVSLGCWLFARVAKRSGAL